MRATDPGDIVLIRTGSYDETLIIGQEVVLRALRGVVLIVSPP